MEKRTSLVTCLASAMSLWSLTTARAHIPEADENSSAPISGLLHAFYLTNSLSVIHSHRELTAAEVVMEKA
jgi:hypothetical protein